MVGYCAIRIKTHDIYAEWSNADGVRCRKQVGIRHLDNGVNREVLDPNSFPFNEATITAVPIGKEK